MPKQYKLISNFDGNDEIKFEVADDENAETRGLEELGWFVVPEVAEEKKTE